MAWKLKKLGENQNPIQHFVSKVKNVKKNSDILVKASRFEVKPIKTQTEKYNIRGKRIRYIDRHI